MRSLVFAALAAVSLVALPALAADDQMVTVSPEQIGQIFCISRLGNDEAVISGLIGPELQAAIADAEAKDDAWAKEYPGDKPPMGDGIPWTFAPDYAAKCDIGKVTLTDTEARVELHYGFPEYPDANYTDVLVLKRVDQPGFDTGFWRIDNIVYPDGTDLRTALIQIFEGLI